ncbi:MAG: TRAP transporter large permease subunit [Alphaproteobacteria bacterium]|nr:MAG: TRAP transporter large permease subunit [Alphaproteobacteria bacterium]
MLFGLDGVEFSLIIVFICLFGGIMSGFPVAFAIGGAAVISFGLISLLDAQGILIREAVDTGSDAYQALVSQGIAPEMISRFRYPDLPLKPEHIFERGWEDALTRNISFIVNRMNERVMAGPSIETLLAVLMFVMMGITLERSRIANDLLTTMARVFGPLPGGLAVSIVAVGAFLAASTGIVGATVVTMGLLALPTMLRHNYSPELATGVIAASGTLGQIIPPSIVIVLLGTLAGDLYATAQENRAMMAGCTDALTYLGQPAVLSVGTLFQAAILPGIFLALLYAAYSFGFALLRPHKAPPIPAEDKEGHGRGPMHGFLWYLAVPGIAIAAVVGLNGAGLSGSQDIVISSFSQQAEGAELRTKVSEACKASMIKLHGQEAWDRAVAKQAEIDASGGETESHELSPEEIAAAHAEAVANAAPLSAPLLALLLIMGIALSVARGTEPDSPAGPLVIGAIGIALSILVDLVFIGPLTSSGATFLIQALPFALICYGLYHAARRMGRNDLLRVAFPPLVLIVAVLGSILGGITNPTPAAALGAGGALMLAAYRKLEEDHRSGRMIIYASFALVIMLLMGINFDLRVTLDQVSFESRVAYMIAVISYFMVMIGIVYSCVVLFVRNVLTSVVRETAKVTSMVFTILIGSQMLNLVVISFGGEHYIQSFLRSFDQEWVVFLIVMLVLFFLGFVLDFLEIIYIVVPIVGPVIYGGTLDPKWVTIMIAVNLQTSFLTPPFGFALFYLRGVAPPSVTTWHIYRGVVPFVLIQVLGLAILWEFPSIITIVPDLIGH